MEFTKANPEYLSILFELIDKGAKPYTPFDIEGNILELDFSEIKRSKNAKYKHIEFSAYFTLDPLIINLLGEFTCKKFVYPLDNVIERFSNTVAVSIFRFCEYMIKTNLKEDHVADIMGICIDHQDITPMLVIIDKDFLQSNLDDLCSMVEKMKQKKEMQDENVLESFTNDNDFLN